MDLGPSVLLDMRDIRTRLYLRAASRLVCNIEGPELIPALSKLYGPYDRGRVRHPPSPCLGMEILLGAARFTSRWVSIPHSLESLKH
jgi:hypothetical protein